MSDVAELGISDFHQGLSFSFVTVISTEMIDRFAALTGDVSPLHMDSSFAVRRGFKGRVVHGALLSGLVSRMIGVHFPGRNCLLHSMNLKFPAPTYAGDSLKVSAVVDQVSAAAGAAVLQLSITNTSSTMIVATGKVTIGFTSNCHNT